MQRPQRETVTLNDILITEELSRRSPRPPNWQAQAMAMQPLARQMARDPETLLQTLVDLAVELCQAGSAVLSLPQTTEAGEEVFRWSVISGALASLVGNTTSRNSSSCGVCLERGTPVLFAYPDRYFTDFQVAEIPVVEVLVLPLQAESHTLGTIWILSHNEHRHFDGEDVRVMTSLADFTAAALQLMQRQTQELLTKNAQLEVEVGDRKLAEIALRESEELSRALIENLPGGAVFVVDRNLRYQLAEGEALSAAGFKSEDLVGHTIFEVMPPELTAHYEQWYRQGLAGEAFEYEHDAHDRSFITCGTPLRLPNGKVYAVLAVSYDISDRKQAEVALRVSEERLQTAQKAGNVGVWDWDAASGKTYWSETMWTLYGYESQPDKTGDEIWESSQHPEDQQRVKESIAQFLASNEIDYRGEFRIIQPNGSVRWIEAVAQLIRDATGKPVRMSGVNLDITDRKQAEAALAHSRRQLEKIAATTPDLVYVFDLIEERNTYVNAGIQQVLGYSQAQIATLGSSLIGSLIHPDDIPGVIEGNQRFRDLDDREVYDHELRMRHATGEYRWLRCRDAVFERAADGTVTQIIGTAQDVTEHKKAEATLRESERKLQSAIAVAQLSPYEWNPLTNELKWDARLKAMWGLPADAQINYEIYNAGIHPQDREYVERQVAKAIDPNGDGIFAAEFRTVGIEDKIERWVSVRGQTFFDGQGRPVQYVGVAQDVTDRKQAEANRIQLIQEQTAREEERQRAEALAQLDRAKTAFFSNVSHEFRTPLTLLLAPLQDALSDTPSPSETLARTESLCAGHTLRERERTHPLPQEQRERLELAHRNGLRLLKLVNTLLDFSRIEAGRMEAVYEPTDLATFTTELASVFRSAIERAGLRLVVDCPPMREPVYVDQEMWEKIVLNLLSNAFKFTLEGEIAIRLRLADDDRVMLQVEDTGTGIELEQLPHLFERFYQVRGAKARTHEGSGIGLALVRELIKLHGGTVDVTSTVGVGSCFSVTIPLGTAHLPSDCVASPTQTLRDRIQATRTLASTALGAAPYVQEAERWIPEGGTGELGVPSGDKGQWGLGTRDKETTEVTNAQSPIPSTQSPVPRVLIVDDNADMRGYLTRILSEHHEVIAVADGAAALAAVNERVPDLVLTDVMMPELDGFDLLKALRTDPRTKEVPIVLLSARAGVESVIEGLLAGADDYLIKPFSATELVTRVNTYLQMAHLRSVALRSERIINRRKDEILSTVSHELNIPLVAILGWTRLLRSSPSSQAMLMKALETIERNATLQAKLVQDLLDISRIAAGKIHLNLQPVELQQVIDGAIATVRQSLESKDICLDCLLDPLPRIVQGDPERLQQIVLNLLTNAVKFTPLGGRIEVSLLSHEHQAEIRITDTGCGIDGDFLPYIFDTFRQADGVKKGLGLGLAIARSLVELHGGTIHAKSPGIGQGATFIVVLLDNGIVESSGVNHSLYL
ncbi:ATP-binding protein [Scytonema sp. NUACC26]|uniref:ATP-binding protein n=1 Tax=Scytonema sp. NUACC26 TaxID=3140176 RepID=UPI0034DBA5A7